MPPAYAEMLASRRRAPKKRLASEEADGENKKRRTERDSDGHV
jgi:hypothetical protein